MARHLIWNWFDPDAYLATFNGPLGLAQIWHLKIQQAKSELQKHINIMRHSVYIVKT